MAPKLRHNRPGWLAYLRGVAKERESTAPPMTA